MPEPNGQSREETLRLLLESNVKNWEEHERIWQAVAALKDDAKSVHASVMSLTAAIRELIDRIPPENLR